MHNKSWLILLLFVWSCVPVFCYAQSGYTIVTNPSFPEPEVQYTAGISGTISDIADITWSIDGTVVREYQGRTSVQLQAPEFGKSQSLSAQIRLIDGTALRQNKVITPIRTDLIVTADTLTPGFYMGRKEGSSGSSVRVSALTFAPPRQTGGYTYLFEVGGKVQNSGLPTTNNSVVFESGFEREVDVSVSVYRNGTLIDSASVLVPMVEPEVHFYERNLLRGLLYNTLRSPLSLIGQELRVRAEPYFVDREMVSGQLVHTWKVNNAEVPATTEDPKELILLSTEGETGARVSFEMYNLDKLLQSVSGILTVQF